MTVTTILLSDQQKRALFPVMPGHMLDVASHYLSENGQLSSYDVNIVTSENVTTISQALHVAESPCPPVFHDWHFKG